MLRFARTNEPQRQMPWGPLAVASTDPAAKDLYGREARKLGRWRT